MTRRTVLLMTSAVLAILMVCMVWRYSMINREHLQNPIASAIAKTCPCDASLNDIQSQVDALSKKIDDTVNETKQNIQNVGSGLGALNGDAPTSKTKT